MKILFIGDIVGRPGRRAVKTLLPNLVKRHGVDLVVANGENMAGGTGATPRLLDEMHSCGVHLFTLGNHAWRKQEMIDGIDLRSDVARPANFPESVPGKGHVLHDFSNSVCVGVISVVGRVFMEPADCPFVRVEKELKSLSRQASVLLIDMHAEATSEKAALAWHLDGRCTAVLGTHTHVQTSDERILPKGTAFITDVGMCGPYNSILGVDKDRVINKLMTGFPIKWEVAEGMAQFNAVLLDVDVKTGRALSIKRIRELET